MDFVHQCFSSTEFFLKEKFMFTDLAPADYCNRYPGQLDSRTASPFSSVKQSANRTNARRIDSRLFSNEYKPGY